MIPVVVTLLILHGPNGGEVRINPNEVTSLVAATPGQPNRLFVHGARCLVNLTDGKFAAVVETCVEVARQIQGQ